MKKVKETIFKYNEANKVKKLANSNLKNLAKNLNSEIGITPDQRKTQVEHFGSNKATVKKFPH